MEPLIDYLYIDHKRLDSYFEQIADSPMAYDKVPTFKGSAGLTNLGTEVTQNRYQRPFTTHEKIKKVLEYLRKGNFLFEFKEEEFHEYVTECLSDEPYPSSSRYLPYLTAMSDMTWDKYNKKSLKFDDLRLISRKFSKSKKEEKNLMERLHLFLSNYKFRLEKYKQASSKKFHLITYSLRKVVIPSSLKDERKDITLWIYFIVFLGFLPMPLFNSTVVLFEESNRENEIIESPYAVNNLQLFHKNYPGWIIDLALKDKGIKIEYTTLNIRKISDLKLNLYMIDESDFFNYLTELGAIVSRPQKIFSLYRKFPVTHPYDDHYSYENFQKFLYGAPIFIASAE